ncbi:MULTISPECIES: DUF305 domain-containing protein [unclassified Crossiella]|uniref:DUF305 domain-containing protein n=1 Tax=unclassified Crossiella TaxID=2620835 RepID=UPI002000109E|nr:MULTISPECIES: DUF305 domain-containing protein [unclassified Crossiella]MCK2244960.1 DUF305 domain-containing protein [Crossiella sp. S99.2]MCK2258487.1 DUF305 domain-containing protein [Crossiella sp. S99.1]
MAESEPRIVDETDPGETEELAPRAPSPAMRILVATAAVLAILMLGAAGGLLINLPSQTTDSSVPALDSPDTGFAQDMAVHHLQAVEMAAMVRDRSSDKLIRELAFDIESTQLEQVGRMKGWLALWGHPEQSPSGKYMEWMKDAPAGHGHKPVQPGQSPGIYTMPGMATQDELSKLRKMNGVEFEVYFLQLMRRHHIGGAEMANYGRKNAKLAVVRNLAENILKAQHSELDVLDLRLVERNAEPLPQN